MLTLTDITDYMDDLSVFTGRSLYANRFSITFSTIRLLLG